MTLVEQMEKDFGQKLQKIMAEKNYSANLLSKRIGINRTSFTKYFNGEATPRVGTFLAICKELDISPNYFLESSKTENSNDLRKEGECIISSIFYLLDKKILFAKVANHGIEYTCVPLRPSINEAVKEYLTYENSKIVDFFRVKEKLIETYSINYCEDKKLNRSIY